MVRKLPAQQQLYIQLMRLDKPTGIWLLFWPCGWSIMAASSELSSWVTLLLFFMGAVLMRSAGCVINDLVDQDIDKDVARTKDRPLASGALSEKDAFSLLAVLLAISALILLSFNGLTILLGFASIIPVVLYPFMKRITYWPQAFLGLVFNWGALMGWAAVRGELSLESLLLYVAGIFWTLGYDTIYGHQDKADDIRIGVKSTALRLGENTKYWVAGFYAASLLAWLSVGVLTHQHVLFFLIWGGVSYQMFRVLYGVNLDSPEACMEMFKSNALSGGLIFLAFALG